MINKKSGYRYLFGPVPSRRLGISLGVDLVPHKTCSLNCVYCECGRTTHLTMKRDDYLSFEMIKRELSDFLSHDPPIDFITFSGGGEPTLNRGLGKIIRFLKSSYPKYKVALLTNGTLLHEPEVRAQLLDVDLIIASFDAASRENFARINRPHPGLSVSNMMAGFLALKREFQHQFWVEVFLVPGYNDHEDELAELKRALRMIDPDRIHLNTLDRPGTETWVKPVEKGALSEIAKYLDGADLIGDPAVQKKQPLQGGFYERLLSTIRRRPCTVKDVSQMLGIHEDWVLDQLVALKKEGVIQKIEMPRGVFYTTRE